MSELETLILGPNGWVPNNSVLPVLIYRGVVPSCDPDAIEAQLLRNDWRPDWRYGVYSYHHYHSTAHEALACSSGKAELMLGGEGGRQVQIEAGDLLVLPAGTGHCHIIASDDFLLVGAYPQGQGWDVCRTAADRATLARIAAVPLPKGDPIDGTNGALTRLWSKET